MLKKIIMIASVCLIFAGCDSEDNKVAAIKNKFLKSANITSEETATPVVTQVAVPEAAPQAAAPEVAPQAAAPQVAAAPVAAAAKPMEDIQPSDSTVEDAYAAWLWNTAVPNLQKKCVEKGIDLSEPACGKQALFEGDGYVRSPQEDPDWVNARSLAYDEALIHAYQKVAEYLSLSTEVKMLSELLNDSEKPTLGDDMRSNVEVLLDKAIAVAGGQLDQKLTELGINPAQFNAAPDSVKKTMLRDAVTKQSVTSAVASTTGLIPYQTFEGKNGGGQHMIRVVVSAEPDRIALVKTILSKQGQVLPNESKKSAKTLYERLVLDKSVLMNQFGTRLMYDEYGYPVLVAFGQAGVEKALSNSGAIARLKLAQKKAVAHADSVLTVLLNSTTATKNITKEVMEHLEDMKLISDKDVGAIQEELSESDTYSSDGNYSTSVSGRISNFTGRSEFYNWVYEIPETKQKVAGVILVWSPRTARHAQDIKTGRTSPTAVNNQSS
ncbi:MAG: hypothetical protein IKR92_03815, partial [Alphaproteobacteria bacterium]|nr:hypothetical protein [Alphaproteobacteria bacterium]